MMAFSVVFLPHTANQIQDVLREEEHSTSVYAGEVCIYAYVHMLL